MSTESNIVQTEKTNSLALIAIITGGLALLVSFTSFVLAFVIVIPGFICGAAGGLLAVAAIVTGIIGLVQVNKPENTEKGKGLAIAGIAMGGLGLLVLCVVPLISAFVYSWSGMRMHMPRFWRNY
jgi:ABC-type phosphate/phosphonate transport system permease subunit